MSNSNGGLAEQEELLASVPYYSRLQDSRYRYHQHHQDYNLEPARKILKHVAGVVYYWSLKFPVHVATDSELAADMELSTSGKQDFRQMEKLFKYHQGNPLVFDDNGNSKLWESLPEELQNHFYVRALAARNGHLKCIEDLPPPIQDKEGVLGLLYYEGETFAFDLWDFVPESREDYAYWKQVICSLWWDKKKSPNKWPLEQAPITLRSDPELMLSVCKYDPKAIGKVSPSLIDKDFLHSIFTCGRHFAECPILLVVKGLPSEILLARPELMVYCFSSYFGRIGYREQLLLASVHPDVRFSDAFNRAWFTAGGTFLPSFPTFMRDDKQLFCYIAENAKSPASCFRYASGALKDDKDLMLKAIEADFCNFHVASNRLQDDEELITAYLARAGVFFVEHYKMGQNAKFLECLQSDLGNKLELRDAFVKTILPCLSLPMEGKHHSSCPLLVLNQDSDTTLGLKQLLVEYLGVPVGKELWTIRRAFASLVRYGEPIWPTDFATTKRALRLWAGELENRTYRVKTDTMAATVDFAVCLPSLTLQGRRNSLT